MLFSLVIPTYNERQNIAALIQRATSVIKNVTDEFEIIVVDDDSPDDTWQLVEELARSNPHLKVIRRRGKGLAMAVVAGWHAAKGEILGVIDGDLQHPPEVLQELLNSILQKNADVVVASRYVAGGGVSEWSLRRRYISWAGTILSAVLLPGISRAVRDPMSGYFLLRCSVIESITLRPAGYKILLEVLARGKYMKVAEVPYVFEERKEGGSKLGFRQYMEFLAHIARLGWDTNPVIRLFRG